MTPMNRRQFLTSLSAVTLPASAVVLPTTVTGMAPPEPNAADGGEARTRIGLQGRWKRDINGVHIDAVDVPSSIEPSGCYRLTRTVVLPALTAQQRAVIHFDGINYHGRVFVNGAEVGTTLPYVPAEFEITPHMRAGANTVAVVIADLGPQPDGAGAAEVWLGVTRGWEAYGGIIRDTWIEVRPAAYVDTARVTYQFGPAYATVACQVTVWLSAATRGTGHCTVRLVRNGTEVAQTATAISLTPGLTETTLACTISAPALWSPEDPNLYEVHVTLQSDAGTDAWMTRTGFRETTTRGRDFLLNGEPLVLNGVCRHDLWQGQGMTLTRAQMEHDMRAIKTLGGNFVRLVHYPHDRYIIELADELGLFVSEEPGYWHVDFSTLTNAQADIGIRVLEGVVRRDWNSPAVFAWLLADESKVSVEYLRTSKARVRTLDPLGRFVSVAQNASTKATEETQTLYDAAGMDFYTSHHWWIDGDQSTGFSENKPFVFTAWRGVITRQVEYTLSMTVETLLAMVRRGVLAGHCFWSWQDLPRFSHPDPDIQDGILESGIVTEAREPRQRFLRQLTRLFARQDQIESPYFHPPAQGPILVPLHDAPWPRHAHITPVDLTSMIARDGGADIGDTFANWNPHALEIAGVHIPVPMVGGAARPVVLAETAQDLEIPIHQQCTRLHFLGQVQWKGPASGDPGFPVSGQPGMEVASYQIRYQNGQTRTIPLRLGFEIAAANTIAGYNRIDPVATNAPRAFWYIKEWQSEQYQALLFSVPVDEGLIESVRCHIKNYASPLLLFAVLAESQ